MSDSKVNENQDLRKRKLDNRYFGDEVIWIINIIIFIFCYSILFYVDSEQNSI